MKQECSECKFWQDIGEEDESIDKAVGRCRRYPPKFYPSETPQYIESPWEWYEQPFTVSDSWCGEFVSALPSRKSEEAKD